VCAAKMKKGFDVPIPSDGQLCALAGVDAVQLKLVQCSLAVSRVNAEGARAQEAAVPLEQSGETHLDEDKRRVVTLIGTIPAKEGEDEALSIDCVLTLTYAGDGLSDMMMQRAHFKFATNEADDKIGSPTTMVALLERLQGLSFGPSSVDVTF
jgi:hypothetical protein